MFAIQNDATNEIMVFTQEQVNSMLDNAPDDHCRTIATKWLVDDATAVLNSDAFHFICYLAARCWIGKKNGEDRMNA